MNFQCQQEHTLQPPQIRLESVNFDGFYTQPIPQSQTSNGYTWEWVRSVTPENLDEEMEKNKNLIIEDLGVELLLSLSASTNQQVTNRKTLKKISMSLLKTETTKECMGTFRTILEATDFFKSHEIDRLTDPKHRILVLSSDTEEEEEEEEEEKVRTPNLVIVEDSTTSTLSTPIISDLEQNLSEWLRQMKAGGPVPDDQNSRNLLLSYACRGRQQNDQIIRKLIEADADVNAQDEKKKFPFEYYIENNRNIMSLLNPIEDKVVSLLAPYLQANIRELPNSLPGTAGTLVLLISHPHFQRRVIEESDDLHFLPDAALITYAQYVTTVLKRIEYESEIMLILQAFSKFNQDQKKIFLENLSLPARSILLGEVINNWPQFDEEKKQFLASLDQLERKILSQEKELNDSRLSFKDLKILFKNQLNDLETRTKALVEISRHFSEQLLSLEEDVRSFIEEIQSTVQELTFLHKNFRETNYLWTIEEREAANERFIVLNKRLIDSSMMNDSNVPTLGKIALEIYKKIAKKKEAQPESWKEKNEILNNTPQLVLKYEVLRAAVDRRKIEELQTDIDRAYELIYEDFEDKKIVLDPENPHVKDSYIEALNAHIERKLMQLYPPKTEKARRRGAKRKREKKQTIVSY